MSALLPRTQFLLFALINSISHILRIFHKICQLFREYIWEWTQTFSWWLYRVNTFTKGWISSDEITMWTAVESYYGFRIRSSGKQLIAYSHSHLVFLLFALNFMPNKSSKRRSMQVRWKDKQRRVIAPHKKNPLEWI